MLYERLGEMSTYINENVTDMVSAATLRQSLKNTLDLFENAIGERYKNVCQLERQRDNVSALIETARSNGISTSALECLTPVIEDYDLTIEHLQDEARSYKVIIAELTAILKDLSFGDVLSDYPNG